MSNQETPETLMTEETAPQLLSNNNDQRGPSKSVNIWHEVRLLERLGISDMSPSNDKGLKI